MNVDSTIRIGKPRDASRRKRVLADYQPMWVSFLRLLKFRHPVSLQQRHVCVLTKPGVFDHAAADQQSVIHPSLGCERTVDDAHLASLMHEVTCL
jgi:hypothetical protein